MRWATFTSDDAPSIERVGVVVDGVVYALPSGARLVDVIKDGQDAVRRAGEAAVGAPASTHDLADVRLRPPIPNPPSIRDFASFREHIEVSMGNLDVTLSPDWFAAPTFYFTSPNNLFADGEVVRVPGDAAQMDYELEVCAVIGVGGINIAPSEAHRHIAGFAIFNDWSARDLQSAEMRRLPVGPGKGKDASTSIGPYLVTPDELEDRISSRGYDLTMTATVNGRAYSAGNLVSIGWSFAEMIAFASRSSPLVPGDVIGSGTVGTGCILELSGSHGSERYPWLKNGDEVVLEVERLGTLRNVLAWDKPPVPLRS